MKAIRYRWNMSFILLCISDYYFLIKDHAWKFSKCAPFHGRLKLSWSFAVKPSLRVVGLGCVFDTKATRYGVDLVYGNLLPTCFSPSRILMDPWQLQVLSQRLSCLSLSQRFLGRLFHFRTEDKDRTTGKKAKMRRLLEPGFFTELILTWASSSSFWLLFRGRQASRDRGEPERGRIIERPLYREKFPIRTRDEWS